MVRGRWVVKGLRRGDQFRQANERVSKMGKLPGKGGAGGGQEGSRGGEKGGGGGEERIKLKTRGKGVGVEEGQTTLAMTVAELDSAMTMLCLNLSQDHVGYCAGEFKTRHDDRTDHLKDLDRNENRSFLAVNFTAMQGIPTVVLARQAPNVRRLQGGITDEV
eukprot:767510-Hanusia_phi.AAC.9